MRPIGITTLLLTFAASFSDAATFIGADRLFTAHVTGNFIVLVYDIVHHVGRNEWSKLLAFPVFFLAVIAAGKLNRKGENPYLLLQLEGGLLLLAGMGAWAMRLLHVHQQSWIFGLSMTIVVAMAFQNAFGRLYAKEIYGPTTVMTGNVTSAALDIADLLWTRPHDPDKLLKLQHNLGVILVFLVGCLAGGLLSWHFGLITVLLPGGLVLSYFSYIRRTKVVV
jgi:uncharacterized membrane protein YoaK (UPF0700 family)